MSRTKRYWPLLAVTLVVLTVGACSRGDQTEAKPDTAAQAVGPKHQRVAIKTNKGDIEIELYADKAPKTVENFLKYVDDGFYKGTIFHRVIKDFMVQGGGYDAELQRKPTRDPIPNEANNGLRNETGTVAMARTSQPHSATSQFFINVKDNKFLDFTAETPQGWGYAVFGRVVAGMDVVTAIEQSPTTDKDNAFRDLPETAVVIETIARK
jgi:peptidyl-prolyl cis-trans isomerase B (cyclophilin B)